MSDAAGPIVIVGSITMGLVPRTARIRSSDATMPSDEFAAVPGGRGANQAVAVARLGGRAIMVGRVGQDDFGRELVGRLKADGVDCGHVQVAPGEATGTAMIVVADSGEHSITVTRGANSAVVPADVDAAGEVIRLARVCLLQLELPLETVAYAIEFCRCHGVETILDTTPVPTAGIPDALVAPDILSPNETEASQLTGLSAIKSPQAVAAALRKRGCRSLVMKLGQRGAYVSSPEGESAVPGFAIQPVDPTGAGDAFTAALAVARTWGWTLAEATRFANAAGALACTRKGSQPSLPTRPEVESFFARQ